jgi:hypothetical protein
MERSFVSNALSMQGGQLRKHSDNHAGHETGTYSNTYWSQGRCTHFNTDHQNCNSELEYST